MQQKPSLTSAVNRWKSLHHFTQPRIPTLQSIVRLLGVTVLVRGFVVPVLAQQTIGSDLCGTPLARTINFAAPLFVGITMIASAILAYVLHSASGFAKDPQSVESIKGWRNRATYAAVTTPLFAFVIDLLIRATGVGIAGCVNIVPFF